jgi:hypothetical protein
VLCLDLYEKVAKAVSVNDIVTWVLGAGAVVVSIVALLINNVVDKRATREALKNLVMQVSEQCIKYQTLSLDDRMRFRLSLEIQILVRQADYLMARLGTQFSESCAVTLAQALELIQEFWWADTYWRKATATKDRYFRAKTFSYWGLALLARGEWVHGGELTEEAVGLLSPPSTDDYIVRGDIYRAMAQWDNPRTDYWLTKAQEQYQGIPAADHRHEMYMNLITEAHAKADSP